MSGSRKPNNPAEFYDEFTSTNSNFFFNEDSCSPQSPAQHDFRPRFMTGGLSPITCFPHSPLMSSYSQPLPSSAPAGYLFTNRNSSWPSKDMNNQSARNYSFNDGLDTDVLHGIDIPGAHVSPHPRIMMSPDESFQDAYLMRPTHSHESSSFDNSLEQFPLMDEPFLYSTYSTSPNPLDSIIGSGSWDSHMTLSKPMNRTASLLSDGSIMSNEADMAISEYQDDMFSNALDFGDMDRAKSPLPSTALRRLSKGASTPSPIKKGRKRGLSSAERETTAYIRKIKACQACKSRKMKCDDGIPCKRCIKTYGPNIAEHPCRGEQLYAVADFILQENNFPRGDWQRFLSRTSYKVGTERHRVNLDFGFGIPFPWDVNIITLPTSAAFEDTFLHLHTEYPWTPAKGESGYEQRYDFVLPVKLADDDEGYLASRVEVYLNQLLEDSKSFCHFPAWFSELKVLRDVYWMFYSLPKDQRRPLEQALKLLILVHVGGDIQVRQDENFRRLVRNIMPGYNNYKIKACLIRAQLGPIFSKLAHNLMREILTELEILSPSENASKYPIIVGTFSVVLMAMESLQYHYAKIPFHASHDNPSKVQRSEKDPPTRNLDEFDGADVLLRFYKATKCHAVLGTITERAKYPLGVTSLDVDTSGFLENLRLMTVGIRPYLQGLAQSKTVARNDLSRFFDRLLARMYLLPCENDF